MKSKDAPGNAIRAWESEKVKGLDPGKRDKLREEPIQRIVNKEHKEMSLFIHI